MKKVKVLFFGALSETTGIPEEYFEVSGDLNNLLEDIKTKYPGIADIRFSLAINQEMHPGSNEITDGDEIALLPPFAGG